MANFWRACFVNDRIRAKHILYYITSSKIMKSTCRIHCLIRTYSLIIETHYYSLPVAHKFGYRQVTQFSLCLMKTKLEEQYTGYGSSCSLFLTVCPWLSYLISLSFSFSYEHVLFLVRCFVD